MSKRKPRPPGPDRAGVEAEPPVTAPASTYGRTAIGRPDAPEKPLAADSTDPWPGKPRLWTRPARP